MQVTSIRFPKSDLVAIYALVQKDRYKSMNEFVRIAVKRQLLDENTITDLQVQLAQFDLNFEKLVKKAFFDLVKKDPRVKEIVETLIHD